MPIYKFGQIIKNRREELGYTQEDLAEGICSVPTLSRIENGMRMPTKEHFEMLVQRLGYSVAMLDTYVDDVQFRLHDLKYRIRQMIILGAMDEAKRLLEEYKQLAQTPTQIDRQFCLLYETLLNAQQYSPEEQLAKLEQALKLTCPRYQRGKLPPILSYEEIIILNNIAARYFYLNDTSQAISILYQLKRYYESQVMNQEEILRTQPMVLYNLSKYLGSSGRYDECIEVANLGIRIARETGRCALLDGLLYNCAWSLVRRKREGDQEAARSAITQAIAFASIMENAESLERYQKFFAANFGESS